MFFDELTLDLGVKDIQKKNYRSFKIFELRHGRNVTEGKKFRLLRLYFQSISFLLPGFLLQCHDVILEQ